MIFLKESNSCVEKENELLKEKILKLERDNVVLKEKDSCAKIENESLKQKCLSLEKEINSFKSQVLICQKDNNILQ